MFYVCFTLHVFLQLENLLQMENQNLLQLENLLQMENQNLLQLNIFHLFHFLFPLQLVILSIVCNIRSRKYE